MLIFEAVRSPFPLPLPSSTYLKGQREPVSETKAKKFRASGSDQWHAGKYGLRLGSAKDRRPMKGLGSAFCKWLLVFIELENQRTREMGKGTLPQYNKGEW